MNARRAEAIFSADDHRYMARALQLAANGLYSARPNPRVGCVIVRNGEIVGEGWHVRAGEPHAEVNALRAAGAHARGATCYVTLEPCSHHGRTPPCVDDIIAAGISRVVAAMSDPNPRVAGAGLERLRDAGIAIAGGVLANEAESLNAGFFQRMRLGRPWLRAKVGMSLDGRVAMAGGESKWITSDAARMDVQRWRARSCAVLTSVNTVIADDPALTVRDVKLLETLVSQPLRVIIDTYLRTPRTAKVRAESDNTLFFSSRADDDGTEATGSRIEVVRCTESNGRVDLHEVMRELGRREVNEVLVEAGPTLTGALLQSGLVDELVCYVAPRLMGDAAQPMLRLPGLETLADSIMLRVIDIRQVGSDVRYMLKPSHS